MNFGFGRFRDLELWELEFDVHFGGLRSKGLSALGYSSCSVAD